MSLQNLSIGRRMAVVLGLILLLSALSSLYGVFQLRQANSDTERMLSDNVQTERMLADWLKVSSTNMQRSIAIARSSDLSLVDYFAAASAESTRVTTDLQERIQQRMDTPEEIVLSKAVREARKVYIVAREEVARLKKTGDGAGASKLFSEQLEPRAAEYLAAVQALANSQRVQLDAAGKSIQTGSDHATVVQLSCCLVSLAAGVLLAWVLSRSITRPLDLADRMARAIANLDLSQAAQTAYTKDETGRLLQSIDAMRDALTRKLGDVRDVADGISTASSQIAVGNQDLSTRTEQTAGNLQQAASSMEELTSTVRQSADTASQANQLATSAARVAERGGEVVAKVVTTMTEINTSSKRIADIIGTIDGIAFQTNILALNAAVEAARAGEQGRGFAVVASEVRSLAQRSAEAAKEIKALIGQSVDKVETGSRLVEDAGTTMTEIVSSVKRVTDMIAEITAAASEQSQGIGEVNGAVNQLDQMTQQNAALVEESAAAAQSLREQALRLTEVVGTFRLAVSA